MKHFCLVCCILLSQVASAAIERVGLSACKDSIFQGKLVFSEPEVLNEDLFRKLFGHGPHQLNIDPEKFLSVKFLRANGDLTDTIEFRLLPRVESTGITVNFGTAENLMAFDLRKTVFGKKQIVGMVFGSWTVNNIFRRSNGGEFEIPEESKLYFGLTPEGDAKVSLLDFEGEDEVVIIKSQGRSLSRGGLVFERFLRWFMNRDEPFMVVGTQNQSQQ